MLRRSFLLRFFFTIFIAFNIKNQFAIVGRFKISSTTKKAFLWSIERTFIIMNAEKVSRELELFEMSFSLN